MTTKYESYEAEVADKLQKSRTVLEQHQNLSDMLLKSIVPDTNGTAGSFERGWAAALVLQAQYYYTRYTDNLTNSTHFDETSVCHISAIEYYRKCGFSDTVLLKLGLGKDFIVLDDDDNEVHVLQTNEGDS